MEIFSGLSKEESELSVSDSVPAKLTLAQKRLWLINKIEEFDVIKRNIRVQIRERSSNDSRAKDRDFKDWKRRADDKITFLTREREYYRNQLGQVNRDLKAHNKRSNQPGQVTEYALAVRFMQTAKQHLNDMQFHYLLQMAEGSLRDQTE